MDERSQASAHSSRRNSRSTSETLAGSPARVNDGHDHEDSPIRKKPRLGSEAPPSITGDTENQMGTPEASPDIQSSTSPSKSKSLHQLESSTDISPSKVTLNLRNLNSKTTHAHDIEHQSMSPSPETTQSSSADASESLRGEEGGVPILDAASVAPPAQRSPPVVDISLDDVASDEDSVASTKHIQQPNFYDLLDSFPKEPHESFLTALEGYVNLVDDNRLNIQDVQELAIWLSRWSKFAADKHGQWRAFYRKHDDFWSLLGQLMRALLVKKYAVSGWLTSKDMYHGLVTTLLDAYVSVCTHLASLDLDAFRQHLTKPLYFMHWTQSKHLRNLRHIFSRLDIRTIWSLVSDPNDDATSLAVKRFAESLLLNNEQNLGSFLELGAEVAKLLETDSTVHETLLSLVKVTNDALEMLFRMSNEAEVDRDRTQRFQSKGLECVRDMFQQFIKVVEKQNTTINAEFAQHFIETLAETWQFLTTFHPEDSAKALSPWNGLASEVSKARFAYLQCVALQLKAYRKFMLKGRMELRVMGAHRMGTLLVELWRETSKESAGSADNRTLQLTSDWLMEEKVIEQIVSIDSHPGIVRQSMNIFGFLFSTNTWTSTMSTALFKTLRESQNPHLTSVISEILRKTYTYSRISVLDDFCDHISQFPADSITFDLLVDLSEFSQMMFRSPSLSNRLETVFQILVRLIRHLTRSSLSINGALTAFEKYACDFLRSLSQIPASRPITEEICRDCVTDIRLSTSTVAGSARVIELILQATQDDQLVDQVISGEDTPTALSQYLITTVEKSRTQLYETGQISSQFIIPLMVLTDLMVRRPTLSLSPTIERDLWQSLVADGAINELYRNEAWHRLSRLCVESVSENAFVERCIRDLLPSIKPEHLNAGLVEFTHEAIAYRIRVQLDRTVSEDGALQIPLMDYLWDTILKCQRKDVAQLAIKTLCDYHIHSPYVKAASMSSIIKCHEILVTKSIARLEEFGHVIRTQTDSNDAHAHHVGFQRTIDCLQKFMEEVATDSRFIYDSEDPQRVAQTSSFGSSSDDAVTLKFQAFPPGRDINSLSISSSSTFSQLYDAIQKETRFPDFKTICAGKILNLKDNEDETIQSFMVGPLLLVQNLRKGMLPPTGSDTIDLRTTAGRPLFSRLERLYGLLDLCEGQSFLIFELLKRFPPQCRTRELLQSAEPSSNALFDPARKYRTLYTLLCSMKIMSSLSPSRDGDAILLRNISQKIFTAFTDPSVSELKLRHTTDEAVIEMFLQCLVHCLEATHSDQNFELPPEQSTAIVIRIGELFDEVQALEDGQYGNLVRAGYSTLNRIVKVAPVCIGPFLHHTHVHLIHEWFLIRHPDPFIRKHAQQCVRSILRFIRDFDNDDEIITELWSTYWQILLSLVPRCASTPYQSHALLELVNEMIPVAHSFLGTSIAKHDLDDWFNLLLVRHREPGKGPEDPEPLISGLAQVITTSIVVSSSLLQNIQADAWIIEIFNSLLFPKIRTGEIDISGTSASSISVLNSDSREKLYKLLQTLCCETKSLSTAIELMRAVTLETLPDHLLGWEQDRSLLIRASSGYSGLRNLTNTCYMNSLLTQLFMNIDFRDVILSSPINDGRGSQKLLASTHALFQAMLESKRKFVDTERFAYSIKPYDAPVIDVTVQMDVDEFYNLFFEQCESQIMNPEMKRRFRSIYGGQSVTQIKSLDCDHVSERTEDYLTVSCEVKGKHFLEESLSAFVAGDSMEGDNKYKCESCGDRYVNALKRSCLKNIPDHLAIHLKRFDFDLLSLQRCKIHDYFAFPMELDMAPYTYAALSPEHGVSRTDIFILTGILVHSGSADAGHYYSYIRDQTSDKTVRSKWFEFNDTEVTEFDPAKIGESCFGGVIENGQLHWPKPHSAYMLFYERLSSVQDNEQAQRKGDDKPHPLPVQSHHEDPTIARENDLLVRWYCLLDPLHGSFLRSLMAKVDEIFKDDMDEHGHHNLVIGIASTALDYLHKALSKSRDVTNFEGIAFAMETSIIDCPHCSLELTNQLTKGNSNALGDMLLRCPNQKVRVQTADLIMALLNAIRNGKNSENRLYGIPATPVDAEKLIIEDGCFAKILRALDAQIENIGCFCRSWDEYFQLLCKVAELGTNELRALLATKLFECSIILINTCDPPLQTSHPFYEVNNRLIGRNRRLSNYVPILDLLSKLLSGVDTECSNIVDPTTRLKAYGPTWVSLPITDIEYDLLHLTCDDKQYAFLIKCLEASNETEVGLDLASKITESMLRTIRDTKHLRMMIGTVNRSIEEYYHNFQQLPLALAYPVCHNAPTLESVRSVFHSIKKKAYEFDRVAETSLNLTCRPPEFDFQNGEAILKFLEHFYDFSHPTCAFNDGEYPFRGVVLSTLPLVLSRLLQFDAPRVRERALNMAKKLLLGPFSSLEGDDVEFPQEDEFRLKMIMNFTRGCIGAYQRGRDLGVPVHTQDELMDAFDITMKLLRSIEEARDTPTPVDEAYSIIEDDFPSLYQKYRQITRDHDEASTDSVQMDDEGGM